MEDVSKEEMKNRIENALRDKGESWVAAALVDGSTGYHTPEHAFSLIDDFI